MTRILCTFPGKYGDLLWALPAVRALSRRVGEPIDLLVAGPFGSITSLIQDQPYIGRCAAVDAWEVQDTAPMTPRVPPLFDAMNTGYDAILHLGYRGWPQYPLPFETMACINAQSAFEGSKWTRFGEFRREDLDLGTPWITVPYGGSFPGACGFTDEHFELKYGLYTLVQRTRPLVNVAKSHRWMVEGGAFGMDWARQAAVITGSAVFLGCNSSLHVLAVACGTPVVMMEPNPHRHHEIFYPLGRTGPQVTLVTGIDGLPTFDARHVADTLTAALGIRR